MSSEGTTGHVPRREVAKSSLNKARWRQNAVSADKKTPLDQLTDAVVASLPHSIATFAPASTSFFISASASALGMFSFRGFGAPSTSSCVPGACRVGATVQRVPLRQWDATQQRPVPRG